MFTRRYRTVLIGFIVIFGGVLSVGPTSEFWNGNPSGMRVATAVVALAFGLAAWRTFRLAIKIRPGKVIVRNLWATRWIDVGDVSRFDRPQGVLRGGIRVVRKDGRFVSASAFGTMNNFESSERGLAEVAELNVWLAEQHRSISTAGSLRPIRPLAPTMTWLWRVWLGMVWLLAAIAAALAVANIVNPSGPS